MAAYRDSYNLQIILDVQGEQLEKLEKYWKEPQKLAINLVGDYPDFIKRIENGFQTSLKINVDSSEVDRFLNPSMSTVEGIKQRIMSLGGELDKILSKTERGRNGDYDFIDPNTYKLVREKTLKQYYSIFSEIEQLRNRALTIDPSFDLGKLDWTEYYTSGQGADSVADEVATIKDRLVNQFHVNLWDMIDTSVPERQVVDVESIQNAINKTPIGISNLTVDETFVEKIKNDIANAINTPPPIPINNLAISSEGISSLQNQIGNDLTIDVANQIDDQQSAEISKALTKTLDADTINALTVAIEAFIQKLTTELGNASTTIGETINSNVLNSLPEAITALGQRIQDALNNIDFTISRVVIDPDAIQEVQDRLRQTSGDTRIARISSTSINGNETSNTVTYRTGRYSTESVTTVHGPQEDIVSSVATQNLEAEDRALQRRNDLLDAYLQKIISIQNRFRESNTFTDADMLNQENEVLNALNNLENSDDTNFKHQEILLKEQIALYERIAKARKKAIESEDSQSDTSNDLLKKAQTTINTIESRIRDISKLDNSEDKTRLLSEYQDLLLKVANAQNSFSWDGSSDSLKNFTSVLKECGVELALYDGELNELKGNNAFERQTARAAISANNFERKVETLKKAISDYRAANTKAMRSGQFATELDDIENALIGDDLDNEKFSNLSSRFALLKREISQTGMTGKTTGEHIKAMFEKFGGWSLVTRSMTKVYSTFRRLFTAVRELDTAMVNLRKVSEGTAEEYNKFLQNATNRAQDLGTSITDLVNSSAEFSRLGFNLEESAKLGEVATMYSKVAEDLTASDAAQSIVSTMKAFNIEAERAVEIVDLYNHVGNNFAISSAGIGDSLQRSASSLAAANTTLQETVALTTAANEIMQDPLKVGTSLKTISARIRGAKTELDEMGESTDDLAGGTAKLKAEIQALSGVDIMESPTQFKSIYTVFDELANVWDKLTDVQQATIAEKLGGKNGLNTVYSLISNFQTARDVMSEAEDASGSASKELERSLDSIEGKLGKLSATFQEIANNLLNSGMLKKILDFVNMIGQALAAAAPFVEKLLPVLGVFGVVKGAEWGIGKIKGIGGLGEPAKHRVSYNVPRILISCA